MELIEKNCNKYEEIITVSQNQKLKALKEEIHTSIGNLFEEEEENLFSIENRLKELSINLNRSQREFYSKLFSTCTDVVKKTFRNFQKSIEGYIDEKRDNLEKIIDQEIVKTQELLEKQLRQTIYDSIIKEISRIESQFSEYGLSDVEGKGISSQMRVSINMDIQDVKRCLEFNFNDILDVVEACVDGIKLGNFFPGLGNIIGGVLGLGGGIIKKIFIEDGGRGKAKNKLNVEVRVCRQEVTDQLKSEMDTIRKHFKSYLNILQKKIIDEVDNIQTLKWENQKLQNII